MSEWEPIGTAPRDGTEVLVCMKHSLGNGQWETIMWVDWQSKPYIWPHYKARMDIPFPPQWWMPLPQSPAA